MAVYSHRLFAGPLPTSLGVLIPASADVIVIRDMFLVLTATVSVAYEIGDFSAPAFIALGLLSASPNNTFHYTGRAVVPPGAVISGLAGAPTIYAYISGYTLTSP